MRTATLLLSAMVLGGCSTGKPSVTAPASASHVEAAHDLEAKTVALVARGRSGGVRSYCSGVWVSETTILTANHCVAGAEHDASIDYVVHDDVYATGSFQERPRIVPRQATLLEDDEDHDLALLRAPSPPPHRVARVSLEPVRPGSFVQATGHSSGLWWSYSAGDVAAVRELALGDGPMVWVQATTPISPGNSGCGLFDEAGRLVGLAHGSYAKGQSLNFFVHAQYIDALVRRHAGI